MAVDQFIFIPPTGGTFDGSAFTVTDTSQNFSINANNGHLIFSSSAGSIVTISSSLKIASGSQIIADDGRASAPAIAFRSQPSTGFNLRTAGTIDVVLAGTIHTRFQSPLVNFGTNLFGFASGNPEVASSDVALGRFGANILKITGGATGSGSLSTLGVTNHSGHLVLSSSAGSIVACSGNLAITQGGFFEGTPRTITSISSLSANDSVVFVDATGGNFNVYLPSPILDGRRFTIKKTNATNTVTLTGSASQLIDGATTRAIATQYESVTVIGSGSAWWLV